MLLSVSTVDVFTEHHVLFKLVLDLMRLFQVSTYALLVEDVLEVISDVVVVHEDAASRIQRLTKVPYHPMCLNFPVHIMLIFLFLIRNKVFIDL